FSRRPRPQTRLVDPMWRTSAWRQQGLVSGSSQHSSTVPTSSKAPLWEGPELTAGKHTIVFDFKPDGPGLGKGGTGVLSVDGKEVAKNTLEHTIPVTFPEDESFDIGQDTRTGVALIEYRYDPPFKFTGKINKLTFKLEPEQATVGKR